MIPYEYFIPHPIPFLMLNNYGELSFNFIINFEQGLLKKEDD